MFLPHGKGGTIIDSIEMLKEAHPVIGTCEWPSFQCVNFKGKDGGLQKGDIVLVRKGKNPLALCEIIGDNFNDDELELKFKHINYRKVKVLEFYTGKHYFGQTQGTLQVLKNKNTDSWKFIDKWYKKISNN